MARHLKFLLSAISFYLLSAAVNAQTNEKWSRQIEDTNAPDSFDWVPLAKPNDGGGSSNDRSANARVLTYSQTFPPNAPFRDLPRPQGGFDFPFQLQRFPNGPQSQPLSSGQPQQFKHGNLRPGEPTSQSFFKFEMPYHGEGARPAGDLPTVQTGYQIQHSFGSVSPQAQHFNAPLFNQQPLFPPEFHPLPQKPLHQQLQQKPLNQNFIEDTFPAKSLYKEAKPQPSQHSLQQVAPQVFPTNPEPEQAFELNKPSAFDTQQQIQQNAPGPSASAPGQQQEVQLLYVPYDTLYNQNSQAAPSAQNSPFEINKYNGNPVLPAVNPYQINQFYTPDPLVPQEPQFFSTSTTRRPITTSTRPSNVFQSFASPQFTTTPKSKPKAHQPPLAMFLLRNTPRPSQSDVVTALRDARTVAVIDTPTKQTPDVFVGPAGMPIPSGYVKFDLPYLSQISHTRDLREVPFFVAPLSYRTPNGFHKILLPEPHVGSIVVNRAKENAAQTQQTVSYNTLSPNEISPYQSTTSRPRTRVKQPSPPKDYYSETLREPVSKTRNPFEVTTQRATLQPTRGNKFTYFYDPEAIQEVTSPKITKQDRPKKKRPQNVQVEQPQYTHTVNNPYGQFNQVPNQIVNNDYYNIQQNKPTTSSTSTSTSTTSTTTTTSTTELPPTYFAYSTSPQVDFQSTKGQLYPELNSIQKVPVEEFVPPRFTTRPPPSTSAEEEFRMKQYFRQQDAFRNRPHPTNAPVEQVQYTPVALEYEPEKVQTTTQRNTTPKQRVTFYTPSSRPDEGEHVNDLQSDKSLPANHRPSYNQNEILEPTVEYDPNPYQLPSELPPLTPNLPGLVNNLQIEDKQQHQQQQQNSADQSFTTTAVYEAEQPTRPTRRPINRVRKPVVAKVTSSVSYSESESTSRRPGTQRVRRPFGSRESVSTEAAAEVSTSTTRRPSGTRNSLVRNPNRVRYQPTPEERQSLRLKPRKQYNGSKKTSESEDLDYQRDVLKQNYPVFKPASSRRTTSPTAIPSSYAITTTEGSTSESQQVYTVTPSNSIDNNEQGFPAGLLEPMQIAQQYNEYDKDNYGPGYFPNQEDLNPTEPVQRNEISPVYTTLPTTRTTTVRTTTSTAEEPTTTAASTTRRSPFIRRNFPRVRTTTTETPTTTEQSQEERTSARPRIPPRKIIKVRTRTRRPTHPASSTANPEEEVARGEKAKTNSTYRKLNRFNQDLHENDSPRRRYKQQFQLEGQESQWSPSIKESNSSHFKPVNPKQFHDDQHKFENEPEIVTASLSESEAEGKNSDTYEINISANFGSSGAETDKKKPDKSYADLLEEGMRKAPEEQLPESDVSTRTTDTSIFESQRTTINNRLIRHGKWKKLRAGTAVSAHNNDSFETAESQNLGSQLFNSLYNGEQQKVSVEQLKTTTPMSPATELVTSTVLTTTTPTPETMLDTYEITTPKQVDSSTVATILPNDEVNFKTTTTANPPQETTEESGTRRFDSEDLENGDDQDTQPSLFSEVKRQLHELFAIEESDDQAVTAALAAGRRRQDYTNIKRVKPESTEAPLDIAPTTEPTASENKKSFHKNLMDHVVYATSTSTKVTSETEICYRGRCIRSEDLPPNHKLT